jgi:hypothetical protein
VLQQRDEGEALQAITVMQHGLVDRNVSLALRTARISADSGLPMADRWKMDPFSQILVARETQRWAWDCLQSTQDGDIDIHFQHLQSRPPFDGEDERLEVLRRLNEIPGVDVSDLYARRPGPIHGGESPTRLAYELLRVAAGALGGGAPLLGREAGGRRLKSPIVYDPIIRLRLQRPECR